MIIYDTEEIETYCDIVKNYTHSEKKTLKTLKQVETRLEIQGVNKPPYKLVMAREYHDRVEKDFKKRIYAVLIEIDQIILPMIASKQKHMEDEIARMEVIKQRKARKHLVDNWEEKSLDSLSDDSDQEGKDENRPSDIPSSKYE